MWFKLIKDKKEDFRAEILVKLLDCSLTAPLADADAVIAQMLDLGTHSVLGRSVHPVAVVAQEKAQTL